MKPPVERLEISMEELEDILERAKTSPLTEEECAKLHKAFETLMYVTDLVGDKDTTIARLRKILFGASTEKIRNVLGGEGPKAASSGRDGRGGFRWKAACRSSRGGVRRKAQGTWPQRG